MHLAIYLFEIISEFLGIHVNFDHAFDRAGSLLAHYLCSPAWTEGASRRLPGSIFALPIAEMKISMRFILYQAHLPDRDAGRWIVP
jgi:hypothetical protein